MNGKELIKLMRTNGWKLDRIKGSHHIMAKEGFREVPVPVHGKKELGKGLENAILRQVGLR